jgi:hypothetical protein
VTAFPAQAQTAGLPENKAPEPRNAREVLLGFLNPLNEDSPQDKKPKEQEPAGYLEGLDREVSGYPADKQVGYKVFREKCSNCHTINRVLSSGSEEWAATVRQMARKQGSGVSPDASKKITEFLNFWSAHRRDGSTAAKTGESAPSGSQATPKRETFPQWHVNGSVMADESVVLPQSGPRDIDPEAGIIGQFTLGASISLSRKLSIHATVCYGCHSLELDRAYGEYQFSDSLTFRLGRFAVPLGAFHDRYLPTNRDSPSQPLPYIMGMMPHEREFNLGVMPAPLVDNGASLSGSIWPNEDLQLGAEIYVVRGLEGQTVDFDYISSRQFPDNNREPSAGGRATANWGPLAVGVSYLWGHYDPDRTLKYQVYGADIHLKVSEINIRAEFLHRNTDYFTGSVGSPKGSFVKEGYSLEVDAPLTALPELRFFVMQDALSVRGIFLGSGGPTATPGPDTTDNRNYIFRVAVGAAYTPVPGFTFKVAAERWNFSDFPDTWVFHVGAVFMF